MNKEELSIVFVYPNIYTQFSQHEGLQTLSAVLKKTGYKNIHLVHINPKYGVPADNAKIIEEAKKYKPKIFAFTSTTYEYKFCNKLAEEMKKQFPDALFIMGGIRTTIKNDDLNESNFDAFCIGEGEETFLEFVEKVRNNKNWENIDGLVVKRYGKLYKNKIRPFIIDLDSIPMQDWDIIDVNKLLDARKGWLSLLFSRGCPYSCTFCINNALRKVKGFKNYCRTASVNTAITELKYLADKFKGKIKVFNLDDDLLTSYKNWILEFSERYKKEIFDVYGIEWKIESRVDSLDEEMIKKMKESGCREIQFGVETGNQALRDTLNKNVKTEQIENVFKLCSEAGIKTMAFMIIGVPGETKETVKDTLDLLIRIKANLIRPSFLLPIYGTQIYEEVIRKNMMKVNVVDDIVYGEPVVKLPTLDEKLLSNYVVLFPWHMNARLGLSDYKEALEKFNNLSYADLKKMFSEILKMDENLDKKTKPTHYRYFLKNLYYVERI